MRVRVYLRVLECVEVTRQARGDAYVYVCMNVFMCHIMCACIVT
jgi:hypothetical protein